MVRTSVLSPARSGAYPTTGPGVISASVRWTTSQPFWAAVTLSALTMPLDTS
jgi:hypothetical protein